MKKLITSNILIIIVTTLAFCVGNLTAPKIVIDNFKCEYLLGVDELDELDGLITKTLESGSYYPTPRLD